LKTDGGVVRFDAMTYQIHRYPTELIDVIHLTDGERVVIRPVLPQDRELMVAFFHDLPADARCSRFMHAVSEPSSELLREFTQVDYVNHVALVAEVFVDGRETAIGEARYVRTADPSSAEVAVSVAELWQGKGLAELMLTKLECRAAAAGVRQLFSETLATNEKVISLARKAGFEITETTGAQSVMRLEKTLEPRDYKRGRAVFEFVIDDGVGRS
jgi:RimJ/RimL family protein N-acetyltransferase